MKSLRLRLFVFLLFAAVLTALVIGTITYQRTLAQNENLLDYQLRQMALSLRDQGVVTHPEGTRPGEELEVVIQIWTSDGSMLYLSRPGDPLLAQATLGYTDVEANQQRWRVFSLAAKNRVIQVAQPVSLRRDIAASATLRSLAPLLAFVPLMALLIWWTVGNSLASLKRLTAEVEQRDARSLEDVSEHDLPSEITPLASALNALLERLKRVFANQRAFVANAAHELRSPLTALKLQLQLLDRAPDNAAKNDALDKLNQAVDRATHLIEQLLSAAQTDPSDSSTTLQSTNLAETTRQVIADLFVFAQTRHLTVELDAPEQLAISADPARLRMLTRNLLDNAVRYTPEGGTLTVSVENRADNALLIVEDSGPGITESERKQVFQRFYRGIGNNQNGSGLGLAIVKNIVEQHGAQIELATSRYGGLKVVVIFSSAALSQEV